MLSFDEFKEKLKGFGYCESIIGKSKVVRACYQVYASIGDSEVIDKYAELNKAWKDLEEYRSRVARREREAEWKMSCAEDAQIQAEVMRDEVKEMLESFDTAEARDRFRMAKQFEEMAYQENAYQRTEYTKGLALIMAGLEPENKDVSGGAK
jgi:septal ring factor EnvC (AmiA/AmiB activator)